jgi:uncharacterized protein with PQ loop repeat
MSTIIEICGWIGSLSYAIYSIPQVIKTIKEGKTNNISLAMVLLLLIGALFNILYILPEITSPLFYNFLSTFICMLIIIKYYFFPRKS